MVTDDETLPKLLEAIRVASGQPDLDWARAPEPVSGGFWAQIWRVRLTTDGPLGGQLVARVMPDAQTAARETSIQTHLASVGYPTPVVYLAAAPGPELAKAWMLMDHAPGAPMLTDLSGAGAITNLPRLARALPDQLARQMAALHAIDPTPIADSSGSVGDLLRRIHDQAEGIDRRDLTRIAEHLLEREPAGGPVAICHGDLHPFNVLSHPDGDTVLDWSTSLIANPAYDIALTRLLLTHPPLDTPRLLQPIVSSAGRMLARRFTRTYLRHTSKSIDENHAEWFHSLHGLRVVGEVASWSASGDLDVRSGHPFLTLAPTVAAQLRHSTGIAVADL